MESAMDDKLVADKKARLDAELATWPADAAIKFGSALFDAFRMRGWIQTTGDHPTYGDTHIAVHVTGVGGIDFQVIGKLRA
jgi:hypothetical protein